MINTVIFDLDGTLINFNLNFKKLSSKVQDLLKMDNQPTPFLETIMKYTKENALLRNRIWTLIDHEEEENIPNAKIFPETFDVLNQLKKRGYNLALVTLQGQKSTKLLLQKFFLTEIFNPIITRENSYLRSSQIEFVLKILQLSKDKVLMVGDRRNDVDSSRKVGVKCILIRRQYNPLEEIIVIKSLSEIFQYLDK